MKKITLSMLSMALICAPATSAFAVGKKPLGLEMGGHFNALTAENVLSKDDTKVLDSKLAPTITLLSYYVAWSFPMTAKFDIVPELSIGLGADKFKKTITAPSGDEYKFEVKTKYLVTAGVKFRFNFANNFNIYAGPAMAAHKWEASAVIGKGFGKRTQGESDSTSKAALMFGGGYAFTPSLLLDFRAAVYEGASTVGFGAIYKF